MSASIPIAVPERVRSASNSMGAESGQASSASPSQVPFMPFKSPALGSSPLSSFAPFKGALLILCSLPFFYGLARHELPVCACS